MLLAWVAPHGARADANEDARALFLQGVEATHQEHWQEARDHFKQSAALVPKARTLLNLAVVEVRLGMGAEALSTLAEYEHLATPEEQQANAERVQAVRDAVRALPPKKQASPTLPELLEVEKLEGEAAALFEAGKQAYHSGRYKQALEYFSSARTLSQRTEIWYAIGAAADRLRDDDQALSALEAFLAANPDSPLAKGVRARVDVLKGVVEAKKRGEKPPEPPVEPPKVAEKTVRQKRALKAVIVGAVVEAGAVGCAIHWVERVVARHQCGDDGQKCENTGDLDREVRRARILTLSVASVGTALFVPALVLQRRFARAPQVSIDADKNGAFIGLRGQF